MLHKLSLALVFAVLTRSQIASAQITNSGKCPKVKLMEEFHWPDFEGVWYEYAKYRNDLEFRQKCVHSKFTTFNNDTIKIQFSAVKFNQPDTFHMVGKILGPGLFFVTITENGLKETNKILGTDYKSWAVLYSCHNFGAEHAETAWILTRELHTNKKTVGNAMAVLKQNGVSTKHLRKTRQGGCPRRIQ